MIEKAFTNMLNQHQGTSAGVTKQVPDSILWLWCEDVRQGAEGNELLQRGTLARAAMLEDLSCSKQLK